MRSRNKSRFVIVPCPSQERPQWAGYCRGRQAAPGQKRSLQRDGYPYTDRFLMIRILHVLFMAALWLPISSFAANVSATCGGSEFEVVVENRGHPLDNVYRLLAKKPGQDRPTQVHLSDLGGWFFAACVSDKQGRQRLVYQEFCGGSACVEDNYGIVDPQTLKTLLEPSTKNEGNSALASRLLNKRVPHLPRDKSSFCCNLEEKD